MPGGFVEADEAERGGADAEEEGAFDEVSVRGEAREEVGLEKRVDDVADPVIEQPDDAIVRICPTNTPP